MTGLRLALTVALWKADTSRSTNGERVLEQKVLLLCCLCIIIDGSIVWKQMCPWSAGWYTGVQRNSSHCAAEKHKFGEIFPKQCTWLRCRGTVNRLPESKAQHENAKFLPWMFLCILYAWLFFWHKVKLRSVTMEYFPFLFFQLASPHIFQCSLGKPGILSDEHLPVTPAAFKVNRWNLEFCSVLNVLWLEIKDSLKVFLMQK